MDSLPERFLAIGDIHGDLEVLKRALKVADSLNLEPIFFGDIVGGKSDSECIEILRQEKCRVLRGNHDHWATEKPAEGLSSENIDWLKSLQFELSSTETLALHTRYKRHLDGFIEWHQLQSRLEVEDFLREHSTKRNVLAAHTHLPALNVRSGADLRFISSIGLRKTPTVDLIGEQNLIDIGWARDNVVVFTEAPSARVEYLFF